ncbi:MAG TPA: helix-turn-helix domain-containing protein [Ktedonobacteraceae bacterium]|nr:helix-turn-helix domain-containing protein [Ktedonobacteraceae bacterium]
MQERPSDKDKEVLTVEEIAEDLRISEGTVRRWIRQGRLPAFGLGQYRIRRADYEKFLDKYRTGHID